MPVEEVKPSPPDTRAEYDALREMSTALRMLPDRLVCTCEAPAEQLTTGGQHTVCTTCQKVVRSRTLEVQAVLMLEASRGDA